VAAAFTTANAGKVKLQMKGLVSTVTSPSLAPPAFANARVLVAFGGMTRVFTLDSHGSAKAGKDTFRFTYNAKKSTLSFKAAVAAADFTQILSTGPTFTVPTDMRAGVGLFVLFQNTSLSSDIDLSFALRGTTSVRVTGTSADFGIITGRH
jgi:hypothetical protein